MSVEQTGWGDRVVERLGHYREALARIRSLSKRSEQHLDGGQGESLLAILTERQHALSQLMEGTEGLPALLQELDGSAPWLDLSLADHVRGELHRISVELEEISAEDNRQQGLIEEVCRRLQSELQETDLVRSARAAYNAEATVASRFADRHG